MGLFLLNKFLKYCKDSCFFKILYSKVQELEAVRDKSIKADMRSTQSELASILANYNAVYVVTPENIDNTKPSQITLRQLQEKSQPFTENGLNKILMLFDSLKKKFKQLFYQIQVIQI